MVSWHSFLEFYISFNQKRTKFQPLLVPNDKISMDNMEDLGEKGCRPSCGMGINEAWANMVPVMH